MKHLSSVDSFISPLTSDVETQGAIGIDIVVGDKAADNQNDLVNDNIVQDSSLPRSQQNNNLCKTGSADHIEPNIEISKIVEDVSLENQECGNIVHLNDKVFSERACEISMTHP